MYLKQTKNGERSFWRQLLPSHVFFDLSPYFLILVSYPMVHVRVPSKNISNVSLERGKKKKKVDNHNSMERWSFPIHISQCLKCALLLMKRKRNIQSIIFTWQSSPKTFFQLLNKRLSQKLQYQNDLRNSSSFWVPSTVLGGKRQTDRKKKRTLFFSRRKV